MVMPITVLFTVEPIMLVLITHRILQGKTIMIGQIIYRAASWLMMFLKNIARAK